MRSSAGELLRLANGQPCVLRPFVQRQSVAILARETSATANQPLLVVTVAGATGAVKVVRPGREVVHAGQRSSFRPGTFRDVYDPRIVDLGVHPGVERVGGNVLLFARVCR